MTPKQAEKQRITILRDSQLAMYHRLQECLNEVSEEMLGKKEWNTDKVDSQLEELRGEINDHFGIEEA